jgi:uncharacterized membrane protein YhaH (DUF805 family)
MKFSFSDFWRSSGTVGRGPYALVGVLGFAIKHNLDRFVAGYVFHYPWNLFNYLVPVSDVSHITELPHGEAKFLVTLLAMSLPFIWIGVLLTIRRLRSAGLPPQLATLFFVPFINLPFFIFLCLAPEQDATTAGAKSKQSLLMRLIPESAVGSAAVSLLISVPIAFALGAGGIELLGNYGWGIFVAIPFAEGFTAALLYGVRRSRSLHGCVVVACLSIILLGGALLGLAVEGLGCLMMAAPIAFPLAAFGGLCAYGVQRRRGFQEEAPLYLSALLLLTPGVQGIEHAIAPPSPVFMVKSSIDIHASPEQVWKQVVAFSQIPPPTELIFRAGVAYPVRAEISGSGVGAERHCVFSTGAFVEPIQVWDEPRLLKFSVATNPPPMEEWSPYRRVEPRHLHGYLVSEGGQFLLTPMPNGWTRLEGTTWYQHGLWPAQYWRLWSDEIIHQIHMRVLRHIRDEVEVPY